MTIEMTIDELIAKLKAIRNRSIADSDEETDHYEADQLLLEYIGDKKVSRAYNAIDKWYS